MISKVAKCIFIRTNTSCTFSCDTFRLCTLEDSQVCRCVSGVVQEPPGSQEAAGRRVKGQVAPAQPAADLQHRPVAAAHPGAAREVKGQPVGTSLPTVPRLPERLLASVSSVTT